MKKTDYTLAYFKGYIPNKESSKVVEFLKTGDFKSAETKKLTNTNYFRAKLNYENRLLFTFLRYQSETYIVLLETILNHEYEKSKFLRGVKFDEENIDFDKVKIEESIYINQKKEFRYIDKFISFSQEQEDILQLQPPILVVGSAGSGKTSVTIEKLRQLRGRVLYISISNYLVQNSQKICGEGYDNIDFLNFNDFLNGVERQESKEVTFREFTKWAFRHKITNTEQYFEEFKGVLTGAYHCNYLSKEEYLNLGVKHSMFKKEERENLYNYFEKYLKWLEEEHIYDSNIVASNLIEQITPFYDYIVIDEVQDFTNIQIFFILKSLKNPQNFIFAGDSNQIIYANFFSWSKLKEMLFEQIKDTQVKILSKNYRSSNSVTHISNRLLKIKQLRFGSIDKESNYLIDKSSSIEGRVSYHKANHKLYQSFDKSTQDSTEFAIIVFDEESKRKVKEKFSTPLIFTVAQAKGLEYKNVVLVNFIDDNNKIFNEIISTISSNLLEIDELSYSRPKDKENHEIDQYKIYINSLYVAFTRAVENLYIIENKKHQILDLLEVTESKEKKIDVKVSSKEEWLKEAQRLKEMGKEEQAEAILEKIKGNKKESSKTSKDDISLVEKVLLEDIIYKEKNPLLLKDVIKQGRTVEELLVRLMLSSFAHVFENEMINKKQNIVLDQKMLTNYLKKNKSMVEIFEILVENGSNIGRNNMTIPLHIACKYGLYRLAELLINRGVDINEQDKEGRTALIESLESRYSGKRGYYNIVNLLLKNGIDTNLCTYKLGEYALEKASQYGHIGIVYLLLQHDAEINNQNKYGMTALIGASSLGYLEIVKVLVKHGVDIHSEDINGINAYDYATLKKNKKIVKFLKKHGAKESSFVKTDSLIEEQTILKWLKKQFMNLIQKITKRK